MKEKVWIVGIGGDEMCIEQEVSCTKDGEKLKTIIEIPLQLVLDEDVLKQLDKDYFGIGMYIDQCIEDACPSLNIKASSGKYKVLTTTWSTKEGVSK